MSGASALKNETIDLNGCSYAEQVAAGTNNVVTALANTAGIRISLCGLHSNTVPVSINIGGSTLLKAHATSGGQLVASNVLVPPGVALDLVSGASCNVWVWYEVL